MKADAGTTQTVSQETFELFLRHFFDWKIHRCEILYLVRLLSYGAACGYERGGKFSPISLMSLPSKREDASFSFAGKSCDWSDRANDVAVNGIYDDTENTSLKSSFNKMRDFVAAITAFITDTFLIRDFVAWL